MTAEPAPERSRETARARTRERSARTVAVRRFAANSSAVNCRKNLINAWPNYRSTIDFISLTLPHV
jgi:hypothetical protein